MVRNGAAEAEGPRDKILTKIAARNSRAAPSGGKASRSEPQSSGQICKAGSMLATKSAPNGKPGRANGDTTGQGPDLLADQPATIKNIMARVAVIAQNARSDLVSEGAESDMKNATPPNPAESQTGSDPKISAQEPAQRTKRLSSATAGSEDDGAVRSRRSEVR